MSIKRGTIKLMEAATPRASHVSTQQIAGKHSSSIATTATLQRTCN